MNIKKLLKKSGIIITAIVMTLIMYTDYGVNAAGDEKIMYVSSDYEYVKAYIRGASDLDDADYQIGNVLTEKTKSYPISESPYPIRTLILLNNSASIPDESRETIKEALQAVVSTHAEGEMFRLATFDDEVHYLSDKYSDDYTALSNMISTLGFVGRDSRLTDVVMDVLEDLNEEGYDGYARLIVVSDGVYNDTVGGVTVERLVSELKESSYPVYTIGSSDGKNDDALDKLFSISWQTGTEYAVLDETNLDSITDITTLDNGLMVFEAVIPEEAKTGGKHSSRLVLSDGKELIFDVTMPFSTVELHSETEQPLDEKTDHEEDNSIEVDSNIVTPEDLEKIKEPVDFCGTHKMDEMITEMTRRLKIAAIVATVAIILLIIYAVLKKLKKLKKKRGQSSVGSSQETLSKKVDRDYDGTRTIIETDDDYDKTVQLSPSYSVGINDHYVLQLVDHDDPSRSFKCKLTGEVSIGRKSDNDIAITDDTAVHGHHSVVTIKNDSFFIMDLENVRNHCTLDGKMLMPGVPQLLLTGSRLTIGRHNYVVSITEEK